MFDCRLIQLCLQTFKLTLHIHLQCLNELPHLFLSLLIINVLICLVLSVWFCGGDCWGCLLLVMHHAILKDSNLFIGELHKARACIILRLGLQKLILLRINSRILDHFLASLLLVIWWHTLNLQLWLTFLNCSCLLWLFFSRHDVYDLVWCQQRVGPTKLRLILILHILRICGQICRMLLKLLILVHLLRHVKESFWGQIFHAFRLDKLILRAYWVN